MGTKVTILGRGCRVLKNEDPEVSQIVSNVLGKFLTVLTNYEVVRVELKDERRLFLLTIE
jgi:mycothione reductase